MQVDEAGVANSQTREILNVLRDILLDVVAERLLGGFAPCAFVLQVRWWSKTLFQVWRPSVSICAATCCVVILMLVSGLITTMYLVLFTVPPAFLPVSQSSERHPSVSGSLSPNLTDSPRTKPTVQMFVPPVLPPVDLECDQPPSV